MKISCERIRSGAHRVTRPTFRAVAIINALLLVVLLVLGSGCATTALWQSTDLEDWNEPADDAHVQLFQTPDQKNFLVVYDEYSERHDSVHTRAYLLDRNQKRILDRRAPYFTNTNFVHGLKAVPVYSSSFVPGAGSPSLFVVEGHECFTLYQNANTNAYDLPVYNDGRGKIYRVALTPPAVIADATIIGGVLWVESGCPPFASDQ